MSTDVWSSGVDPAGRNTVPAGIKGETRTAWVAEWGGIQLTFHSEHRRIEAYSRALEAAGLLIEAIRETRAPDVVVTDNPGKRRWQRIPLFLHLRAVKPAGARP